MTDHLFDFLMQLFESVLAEIKDAELDQYLQSNLSQQNDSWDGLNSNQHIIKKQHPLSVRIFSQWERFKLTKASYQFLMRLMQLRVLSNEMIEEVIQQLLFSDTRFVTLQETKLAVRNTMATHIHEKQLAFLDLILCQKIDPLLQH